MEEKVTVASCTTVIRVVNRHGNLALATDTYFQWPINDADARRERLILVEGS